MRTDLFDYELPEELIATRPPSARDGGRLLVLDPHGACEHRVITDLPALLSPGSLLVLNDTRVIPARLIGKKMGTGGKVELLLLDRQGGAEGRPPFEPLENGQGAQRWRAIGRSSKPMRAGTTLGFGRACELLARVETEADVNGVLGIVLFTPDGVSVWDALLACGSVPLPPYVARDPDPSDRERYQTVFARVPGAIAAPTAGLHLTKSLLEAVTQAKVNVATLTLHVGLGTFRPVAVEDLDHHPMHEEYLDVPRSLTDAIEETRARGCPVVAVGTTVVRALETAADPERPGACLPYRGHTKLLIQPGYAFGVVDALLTNFHLPRSTLLALVSAFAGTERVLAAYQEAVLARYRFYSYGDAMFIPRRADREPSPASPAPGAADEVGAVTA